MNVEKVQDVTLWLAGSMFAGRDVNYASSQAFEAVKLRSPLLCDIALRHRVFGVQSFEFLWWPHLQRSVPHNRYFSLLLGLLSLQNETTKWT
jgi:hypothetical protein